MPRPHGGTLVDRVLRGEAREAALAEAAGWPRIALDEDAARDVENIAHGVMSPLAGFLDAGAYASVLERGRLPGGLPWTIPIVLDVDAGTARALARGDRALLTHEGAALARLDVEDVRPFDPRRHAAHVFGTTDPAHPGVARAQGMRPYLVGGALGLLGDAPDPYARYRLWPRETRVLFRERGWRTVVGFQTRNAPHLGHEYVQKTALSFVDGLLVNPVIGKKKPGDFQNQVILESYEALMRGYYLRERAVLAVLRTEMRYAGPREAIFHAIVRKNFGCTHFVVGRDHAGVGSFYTPYAAQEIFDDYPDLGIVPLFFTAFFYCRACGSVANEKTCPHGPGDRVQFSGTRIRTALRDGDAAVDLIRPEVAAVLAKWEDPFVADPAAPGARP